MDLLCLEPSLGSAQWLLMRLLVLWIHHNYCPTIISYKKWDGSKGHLEMDLAVLVEISQHTGLRLRAPD